MNTVITCLILSIGLLGETALAENVIRTKVFKTQEKSVSQIRLHKVMEDIRHCDKTVRYEYDVKAGKINPPELREIKGLKFQRLLKNELAIFEINETYEGMHAVFLVMGQKNGASEVPITSVAFRDSYVSSKGYLESIWGVHFRETSRPGPDDIPDGKYAEIVMQIKGKKDVSKAFLSFEKMPQSVYPFIGLVDIGCNHIIN